ncbi:hypothetical protein [Novosphingobium guangzhouense]|uniref:Uncharacterized protein n=1 Tax=Novosphingobium guangzhouense TaxID=1850347 RepID=A0A2K2FYC7_9SPHN|nr:hypothetical protein [Novosphingobium guangzhouense]PNU03796.1 hypothetical protein A8V01_22355 [Novosphingobium guangzhouense]
MEIADGSQDAEERWEYPRLSKWIWTPWYAKFWWSAIPFWWLGMAVSAHFEILAQFYRGALAGFMNVFFLPPVVFILLAVGFFREWLDCLAHSPGKSGLIDDEEILSTDWLRRADLDFMDSCRARGNPMDPRSGPLWIGNRDNPSNPSYVPSPSITHPGF